MYQSAKTTCEHCGQLYAWFEASRHKPHKTTGKPRCLRKRPDNTAHRELVKRACIWLKGHQKCQIVFGEPTMAVNELPDAIGWRGWFSEVIECKTSLSDLKADAKKRQRRLGYGVGMKRWVMMPLELAVNSGLESMPSHEGWGLLGAKGKRVKVLMDAQVRQLNDSGQRCERGMLVLALRRHQIGILWIGDRYRFETYADSRKRRLAASQRPPADPQDAPSEHQTADPESTG
jgi:hypothetical protein